MGGNKCSRPRWIINTLIVFTISGLWHGAAYAFLIWGSVHGIGMIIERLVYGKRIKSLPNRLSVCNLVRWGVTMIFVNLAWIPFRVNNLRDVKTIISRIFTDHGPLFLDINTMLMGAIAMVIVFAHDFIEETFGTDFLFQSKYKFIRYISASLVICYILALGVLNGGSFIYFQF